MDLVEDRRARHHPAGVLQNRAIGRRREGRGPADLGRQPSVKVVVVPELGLVEGVGDGAAHRDDVDVQGVEHVEVRQRQHLPGVLDAGTARWQAQRFDQGWIGEGADARRPHPAQIQRHAVRLSMVEGLEDPFSRCGHVGELLFVVSAMACPG